MKKLSLLFAMLTMVVSGAWADGISSCYLKGVSTGKYIGSGSKLDPSDAGTVYTIREGSGDYADRIAFKGSNDYYIYCGSNSNFSGNQSSSYFTTNKFGYLYEVDSEGKGTRISSCSELKNGANYAFLVPSKKSTESGYLYYLTNTYGTNETSKYNGQKYGDGTTTAPSELDLSSMTEDERNNLLWTMEALYTVNCSTGDGGVKYNDKEYKNGEAFYKSSAVTANELTAIPVNGYSDAEVNISEYTITVTYENTFEEGKPYYLTAKKQVSGFKYGTYVNMFVGDETQITFTTTPTPVYFESTEDGKWKIKSTADNSGEYMGYSSYYAFASKSTSIPWTVTKTADGYTFYWTTSSSNVYMGVSNDTDKNKLYLKPSNYEYIYFDINEKQFEEGVAYNMSLAAVPVETSPRGANVDVNNLVEYTSGGKTYTDLASRSANTSNVYFEYAGDGKWNIKASTATDAKYLTWEKRYYLALGTDKIVPWTITKTNTGYTLYQSVNTYEEGTSVNSYGYLGADANKNVFYMNKGDGYSYIYFTIVPAPITVTRSTAKDSYGTICLPMDATATGATILACQGKNSEGQIVFEYANEDATTDAESTTLKAGVPYLYRATAAEQTFTTTGTTYAEAGVAGGAFQGSYEETQLDVNTCILKDGKFYTVANEHSLTSTNIFVGAYRAYVTKWADLTVINNTPARAFTFSLDGGEATGINGIVDATVAQKNGKFIQNGRVVIVNNGKKYNVAGQAVK